jgi:hypothetical protein
MENAFCAFVFCLPAVLRIALQAGNNFVVFWVI